MKGERSAPLNFNLRLVVTLDRLRWKVLQNESRTKCRLNAVQIWFQCIRLGITLHPFPPPTILPLDPVDNDPRNSRMTTRKKREITVNDASSSQASTIESLRSMEESPERNHSSQEREEKRSISRDRARSVSRSSSSHYDRDRTSRPPRPVYEYDDGSHNKNQGNTLFGVPVCFSLSRHIGNLTSSTTKDDLHEAFIQFGRIKSIEIPTDNTGRSR